MLLALTLAFPALAADVPPVPQLDALIFTQWGLDLTDGKNHTNAFDLTRAYFGARQELGDHFVRLLCVYQLRER